MHMSLGATSKRTSSRNSSWAPNGVRREAAPGGVSSLLRVLRLLLLLLLFLLLLMLLLLLLLLLLLRSGARVRPKGFLGAIRDSEPDEEGVRERFRLPCRPCARCVCAGHTRVPVAEVGMLAHVCGTRDCCSVVGLALVTVDLLSRDSTCLLAAGRNQSLSTRGEINC